MTQLAQQFVDAINSVVDNDEGGWVLTRDPNDTDGGWTYAGVTKKTWEGWLKKNGKESVLSYEFIRDFVSQTPRVAFDTVYQIYYDEYIRPIIWDNNQRNFLYNFELSCSINCGPETLQEIMRLIGPRVRDPEQYRKLFLHYWHLHYNKLIKENAEAWRQYALSLEYNTDEKPKVAKPATLRAEYINGWFNRVEKYR